MQFKQWIEGVQVFDRPKTKKSSILSALGLPEARLQPLNKGSFATIYQHPTDPTKIIKATKDKNDISRLLKAQALNSRNVVKLYPIQNKLVTQVGPLYIVIADKIIGNSMPYTSNVMAMLLGGKLGLESPIKASMKIAQKGYSPFRDEILAKLNKDNDQERSKLSELFATLGRLEKLRIHIADFTDNVIDAGDYYVIIDMGL